MRLFSVVFGFCALSGCLAQADLKLTVVLQIRDGLLPTNLTPSIKRDPKTAKEFEKDMQADPMTALMLGEPLTITEWWSKDKGRVDLGPLTFLLTHKPERIVAYNRRTKTVTSGDPTMDQEESEAPVTTTDTHRTKLVAGHKAKEFTLSGKDSKGKVQTARVWVAGDMQPTDAFGDPVFSQVPSNLRTAVKKLKGAILRTEVPIEVEEGAKKTLTAEVTHISTATIPESIYVVPAGYRKE